MNAGEGKLSWVVCHRATRSVAQSVVQCPLGGEIEALTCLGCRFLTTSSVERQDGPWCDSWPGEHLQRRVPLRVPIAIEAALTGDAPDWPLRLPVLAAGPAVRTTVGVPSGSRIGT